MSKKVLFFPGQASQYVGMGKDLYETSEDVRHLYKFASSEMGYDIAHLSFEGPAEELKRTRFTQPAILLHSLAVLSIIKNNLTDYDFACGHSLGEYPALAAVGALSFEDAIKAVVKRATLMEEACQKNPSTMAAIMGLNESQIEEVCQKASAKGVVVPANFNSGIQTAISGSFEAVEKACELAKEAGAKRAMLLQVGGAFHSPLMETAKLGMAEFLNSVTVNNPKIPVIANVTAQPVTNADEIKKLLVEQITSPVRWSQTMKYLVASGVDSIIEIGPGKVLTGLAKRDMKPKNSVNLDKLEDIEAFTATLA
ncbi:MAG: ACP S-malonyltransferase [candidate division Zixibacteria bacterium]|nr:ACP S-malonyltransferase [candidate division Zixibacteria bacterium]